jgi:NTP pyrophosphatase (non-canonical NTP hydrolase)
VTTPTDDRVAQIRALQAAVSEWQERNFDPSEVAVFGGLAEEVGEVMRAWVKRSQGIRGSRAEWDAEIRKEVGDVFIKLCDIARWEGFDLADAIHARWAKVGARDWRTDPIGHGIGSAVSS